MLAWAFALEPMRRRLDAASHAPRPPASGSGRLALVWRHRALRDLATASFVFHAMQICLNTFLVAFLVGEHGTRSPPPASRSPSRSSAGSSAGSVSG